MNLYVAMTADEVAVRFDNGGYRILTGDSAGVNWSTQYREPKGFDVLFDGDGRSELPVATLAVLAAFADVPMLQADRERVAERLGVDPDDVGKVAGE